MNPGEYLIEKRKQRLQTRLWSRKQPRGRKRFPSVEIQRQKFMKEQRACFQETCHHHTTTFEKRYQQSSNATTFRNAFQNTPETVPRPAGCVWGVEVAARVSFGARWVKRRPQQNYRRSTSETSAEGDCGSENWPITRPVTQHAEGNGREPVPQVVLRGALDSVYLSLCLANAKEYLFHM